MTDAQAGPTLDERIEEARREANARIVLPPPPAKLNYSLLDKWWLTAYSEHLLTASTAREAALVQERDEARRIAKAEGLKFFTRGWNRFAEIALAKEVIKPPCQQLEHPTHVWLLGGIGPDEAFDREYPAPESAGTRREVVVQTPRIVQIVIVAPDHHDPRPWLVGLADDGSVWHKPESSGSHWELKIERNALAATPTKEQKP